MPILDDEETLCTIDLTVQGRMISGSKSGYRSRFPDNLVAFNGGIYTRSRGHVWSGDLDVTRDTPRLQEIARELGETIYIFREKAYDLHRNGETIHWELQTDPNDYRDGYAIAIIEP